MTWVLDDGTKVDVGGRVRGDTVLANMLRHDVDGHKRGRKIWVYAGAIPGPMAEVDLHDPSLVHEWIIQRAVRFDVTVESGPDVKPIERPARGDYPPGTIF